MFPVIENSKSVRTCFVEYLGVAVAIRVKCPHCEADLSVPSAGTHTCIICGREFEVKVITRFLKFFIH